MQAGQLIGLYFPGDSALHRLDPRIKVIASLVFVVALFVLTSFIGLAIMAVALLAAVAVGRVPIAWLYRGIKPVLLLVALTFLFQLLLHGGGRFAGLGPFTFYSDGARAGAFLAARLVLLVLSSTMLTFTTSPIRLTDGLGSLMAPLARLRFPAYELALMVTIALRFIPTLLQELDRIIKAQRARGADITRGGPLRRGRNLIPVLLPLFVVSFRHADDLALAMESRCYRGGRGRTVRRRLGYGWRDGAFALIVAVLVAVSIWVGR